ncbi:MAG: profilin domain protein [Leptospira sp.]|nr:profilin domain protein [Leptospira sp.]
MKPKNLKPNDVDKLFETLKKSGDDAVGSFLIKGHRIQISKHNLTGAERVKLLYRKRRENGLCIVCGTKVTKKNPKSGKLYRLCEHHRGEIDKKAS